MKKINMPTMHVHATKRNANAHDVEENIKKINM